MLKLAKLVSQEFIVGRLVGLYLMNVFVVKFTNEWTGDSKIKLTPYFMPFDNSLNHPIHVDKIITVIDCPQQIAELYIQAVQQVIQTGQIGQAEQAEQVKQPTEKEETTDEKNSSSETD